MHFVVYETKQTTNKLFIKIKGEQKMNYADIKTIDVQDGTGIRVSIYVSGCHFHCKGCHNKEAWDFNYGKKFDDSTIDYILDLMDHDYIAGLSILGGEPMEIINQQGLLPLVQKVKEKFPNKSIWCYTGYKFGEDLLGKMYKEFSFTKGLLENIDIIVDGQFIEEKKLTDLKFRGSINQKKIDVQASLKQGKEVVLKFGDEERYETIKNPKIILFKEYKDGGQTSRENTKESSIISVINNDILIDAPIYEIKEEKEKIAAGSIQNRRLENT